MTSDTIEDLMAELSQKKEWHDIHVCRRNVSMRDDEKDRYMVRNHTDEGLGADERLTAYGRTLEEALRNAVNEHYLSPWEEDRQSASDST